MRDIAGAGGSAVGAGLEHARQLLEARLRQEHRATALAQLALTEDSVAVAV